MHKVLVLGAGMVAHPMVDYLLHHDFLVTVADSVISKAEKITDHHPNGTSVQLDVCNSDKLEKLIDEHDLVVSLLPFKLHLRIAKICIKYKKNMVTTSYIKPEMMALDEEAKNAGIIILNEIGLDPGIDHMSAKKIIDLVHEKNGRIKEFYSFCGALPAPEASNNPFKYRFSWSPEGVILASKNPAVYKRFGEIIEVSGPNLFKDLRWVVFPDLGEVEVYANRDSLSYIDLYDLHESDTVIRGTIRYEGYAEILDAIKSLDLLSEDEIDVKGKTNVSFLAEWIGCQSTDDLKNSIAEKLNKPIDSSVIKAFEYIGLFQNDKLPEDQMSPFKIIASLMIPKLLLSKEERDMILLMHTFKVIYPDGTEEVIKSSMIDYGIIGGDTAIARTVALPAAIAVRLILEGKINIKGVHLPILKEIYLPVLEELETLNIKMNDQFGMEETGIIRNLVVV